MPTTSRLPVFLAFVFCAMLSILVAVTAEAQSPANPAPNVVTDERHDGDPDDGDPHDHDLPEIYVSLSATRVQVNASITVTVEASHLSFDETYNISVTTNSRLGFDSCNSSSKSWTALAVETSTRSYSLYGCSAGVGTVTATVTGGSESASDSRNVTVTPSDPEITGPSSVSYMEEGTGSVATYTANGDSITWSLGGIDSGSMNITTSSTNGVLKFDSPPNYESPRDAGGNNVYNVTVSVSDGRGGSDSQSVAITVTDKNERPEVKTPIGDQELDISQSRSISLSDKFRDPDSDTLSYTNSSSSHSVATLNPAGSPLMIEAVGAGSTTITVRATDPGGLYVEQDFDVTVPDDDANIPPEITGGPSSVTYPENATFSVGTYTATDEDGDPITWSLGGIDSGSMGIGSTSGVLTFDSPPDHENPTDAGGDNVYNVTVIASDGRGGSDQKPVAVEVTNGDTNRDPEITGGPSSVTYPENATFSVGTYTATDPDGDSITWSLGGIDRGSMSIGLTSGVLSFNNPPNYEFKNVYNVTVVASDGRGGSYNRRVGIDITDDNDSPEVSTWIGDQTLDEDESKSISLSGKFSDEDDDSLRYENSSSNPSVATVNETGSPLMIEAEQEGTARVTVTAYDRPTGGKSVSQSFTVTVTGEDLSPPPAPSGFSARVGGGAWIYLNWDSLTGIDSYEIYSKASGSQQWDSTPDFTGSGTTANLRLYPCDASHRVAYDFRIRGYGDGSNFASEWGPYSYDNVDMFCPPPVVFTATATGQTSVKLSWSARSGLEAYRAYYRTLPEGSFILADNTIPGDSTGYTVTGLECEVPYRFSVGALGDGSTYARRWSKFENYPEATTYPCHRTVYFELSAYTVTEGVGTRDITVEMSPAADGTIRIPIDVTSVTAESGDYTVSGLANGELIFGTNQDSRSFTVTPHHDIDTDDETVSFGFGSLPSGVSSGSPSSSVLTIVDDDDPVDRTVYFELSAYTVTEGVGTRDITVEMSPAADGTIRIPIDVTSVTAESGDYTVSGLANGELIFGTDQDSRSFTVTPHHDIDTDDETVSFGFGSLPSGVSSGSPSSSVLTIVDDDDPVDRTVYFELSAYTVTEGVGTRDITVEMSPAADGTIRIPIDVTSVTAESGDYTVSGLANGELIFGTDQDSRSFTVTPHHDIDIDDETVSFGFGSLPSGVSSGSPPSSVLTIVDDDDPVDRTVYFELSAYTVTEGVGTRDITVEMSPAADGTIRIPIDVTSVTAESGDYTVSGLANGELIFGTNQDSRSFTVTPHHDIDIDDETVSFGFGSLPSGVSSGSPSSSVLTIVDDDDPVDRTVYFELSAYTVTEGVGTRDITVEMSPAADGTIRIPIDVTSVTAESGDYTVSGLANGELIFGTDQDSRSFTVTPHHDIDIDDETVSFGFGSLPSGVSSGSPSSSVLTIEDVRCAHVVKPTEECFPAPPPGNLTVSSVSRTSVQLSWDSEPGVAEYRVEYTESGGDSWSSHGTTAGTSYTVSGLTCGTGYEFRVRSRGDGTQYTTSFEYTRPTSPPVTANTDSCPREVSFESSTYTVAEGGTVDVMVTMTPAPGSEITIPVTVTNVTADSTDYEIAGMTSGMLQLTFNSGEPRKTFTVEANEDDGEYLYETVTFGFRIQDFPAGIIVGDHAEATLTIEDNDLPPAPTGLRANGHLVDGKIKLRWNEVADAGYNVRYAEEVCVYPSCGLDVDGNPPEWKTITAEEITTKEFTIDGVTVLEASLEFTPPEELRSQTCYNSIGLDLTDLNLACIDWPLYHVEVQSVIVDHSDWSDFALVFPTNVPPNSVDENIDYLSRVATNGFNSLFQPKRHGSHEYRYTLCKDTIDTSVAWSWYTNELGEVIRDDGSVTAIVADIEAGIERWETGVRWVANGTNIVSATAIESELCHDIDGELLESISNPVLFILDDKVGDVCGIANAFGCIPVETSDMYLRSTPLTAQNEPTNWDVTANGCSLLHKVVLHEAGHVLGLWSEHSLTPQSVMYYSLSGQNEPFCKPQIHDVVAMMANYQSR